MGKLLWWSSGKEYFLKGGFPVHWVMKNTRGFCLAHAKCYFKFYLLDY